MRHSPETDEPNGERGTFSISEEHNLWHIIHRISLFGEKKQPLGTEEPTLRQKYSSNRRGTLRQKCQKWPQETKSHSFSSSYVTLFSMAIKHDTTV